MYDVITIGTATRDVFLTSPDFKTLAGKEHSHKMCLETGEAQCFALGEKIEIDKPVFTFGGGAFNSAITFSRQGLKTATLIKIGNDEAGENILKELAKESIYRCPTAIDEKNTAFSTILLSPTGERTILVYRGASEDLKLEEINFNDLVSRWAYITPGKIPFETIEKLFDYFSENKTPVAFNPSGFYLKMGLEKMKPLLEKSKVVILNREEAAYLTGINYENEKEIFEKLDQVITGIVAMTDGNNGAMVSDGKNIYSAGVFPSQGGKKLIDRTGAGDAFGSGFVAGLMGKNDIEYAIRLGSANATSVVEKIGAQAGILNKSEFEENEKWKELLIKKYK